MITGVSKAAVLVDDQDEARAVWSGHAGMDATLQGPGSEERWIEVAPPARSLSLVLVVEVRGRRRQRHIDRLGDQDCRPPGSPWG